MQHFQTIADYCDAIKIPRPKHNHFDIRSFAENMPTVVHQMPIFRHEFYAIAIRVDGDGAAYTGYVRDFPQGSTVFFNSPFQIISWDISPNWEGYYLMFSQEFVAQFPVFNNLLEDFPYLRIEKSIPFEIDPRDLTIIVQLFAKIHQEYHGNHADKFQIISAYVWLMLNYVRRYFVEQLSAETISTEVRRADLKLYARFQTLIETTFRKEADISEDAAPQSVGHYAGELSVHPNHLNAVVRNISGQTALSLIHQHTLQMAKTYLVQTNMSVREIADALFFESSNYFSRFFKRHTTLSPLAYRKTHSL
ncbi:MAG: helix-turn-helix domain-containing protein [Chloroflexota bacterium]